MGKVNVEIVEKVFCWLMEQPIGTEISLREAFEKAYSDEGYTWVRHESRGWVSSKDGGKKYIIECLLTQSLWHCLNRLIPIVQRWQML